MNKNNIKSNVLTLEDMRDILKSKTSYENCYDLKNSVLIKSYDDSNFEKLKAKHDMEITKDLELERQKCEKFMSG